MLRTIEYIRANPDKIDWNFISAYETLSEDFVREFAEYLDWKLVSGYQKLSHGFVQEMSDRIDFTCLKQNKFSGKN
jgi:hypothetical protein